MRNHPEDSIALVAWVTARRGYEFGRRMSATERLIVAAVSARPTHTMTIDSDLTTRGEASKAFRNLIKRIDRELAARSPLNPRPLIYIATIASGQGSGRFHIHALLWQRLHASVLHGHCRAVGLGRVHLRQLPLDPTGDANYWAQVAYVLGQQEPVFGTQHHQRHEDRPGWGRRVLYRHAKTLAKHCPELLSALNDAKDPAVTDDALLARLPRFSRYM